MIFPEVIYRPTIGSTWINASDYIFDKNFSSFLDALGSQIQFNKKHEAFMAQFSTTQPYDANRNKYFVVKKNDANTFFFVSCQPTKSGATRYHREDTILIDTSEYFKS